MNHPRYEEWIFGDEPLLPEQQLELEQHLDSCPDCRQLYTAWRSAEASLQTPVMASPDTGFALRWQAQAEAEQQTRRRWLGGLWSVLILIAVAALIVASLSVFSWSHGGATNAIVLATDTLTEFWAFLIASFRISTVLLELFPPLTLILVWGLMGAVTIMVLIWLMSYYQLSNRRRTLT